VVILLKKTNITGAALAALLLCACAPSSAGLQFEGVSALTEEVTETAESIVETVKPVEAETGSCFVHVCGAVVNPGMYELPAGSRVFDALECAGGITEEGVPTALNFAEQIYDGEQILVPTWEEYEAGWTAGGTETEEDSRVNINTATKEQLMTLNGIGESRAQAIIAYREEHGPFAAIEDLMQVSGIKEAAFEKVKDDITVN
jgi:competence protein ComEA